MIALAGIISTDLPCAISFYNSELMWIENDVLVAAPTNELCIRNGQIDRIALYRSLVHLQDGADSPRRYHAIQEVASHIYQRRDRVMRFRFQGVAPLTCVLRANW